MDNLRMGSRVVLVTRPSLDPRWSPIMNQVGTIVGAGYYDWFLNFQSEQFVRVPKKYVVPYEDSIQATIEKQIESLPEAFQPQLVK